MELEAPPGMDGFGMAKSPLGRQCISLTDFGPDRVGKIQLPLARRSHLGTEEPISNEGDWSFPKRLESSRRGLDAPSEGGIGHGALRDASF